MRPIFLSKPLHSWRTPHTKSPENSWKCRLFITTVFFFLKIVRLQLAALTIRRPKHPVWQCCTTTFHREIFEDWSLEILIWNTIDIYTASNDHTKFSTAVLVCIQLYMYPDTKFSTHSNMQIPLWWHCIKTLLYQLDITPDFSMGSLALERTRSVDNF